MTPVMLYKFLRRDLKLLKHKLLPLLLRATKGKENMSTVELFFLRSERHVTKAELMKGIAWYTLQNYFQADLI